MYLAGISVRRVENIIEALQGTRVSPSTVSNLNQKIYAKIEAWRNRRIEGKRPYLYLDGVVMKSSWAGKPLLARAEAAAFSPYFKEQFWRVFKSSNEQMGFQRAPAFFGDICFESAPESMGTAKVSRED
jgi:hypothetical protein